MCAIDLQEPFLAGGIQSTNFFNGRLLSGQDLQNEQASSAEARRRLGQAVGEGVAYGLEVFAAAGAGAANPTLSVLPGLAVNHNGRTLALTTQTDVSLVRPTGQAAQGQASSGAQQVANGSDFAGCDFSIGGAYVAGAGLYMLTIAPAEALVGSAPVSGLNNVIAACGTDYRLEGVQFRLIPFNLQRSGVTPRETLRSRVAHECFGTADGRLGAYFSDPFGLKEGSYSLLDDLRNAGWLTECDVPLAVLFWAATQGVAFVDMWAVRRRVTGRAWAEQWQPLVGDRSLAEREATFLQFQGQVADMRRTEPDLRAVRARERFEYLPTAGILPLSVGGAAGGIDIPTFFEGRASQDVAVLHGDALRSLLHEATYHEPIPLSGGTGERIQLYTILENVQAVEARPTTQPALVFASHTLPYRGVAHFGRARWDLGRYAHWVR